MTSEQDDRNPIEVIADEFLARYRRGERPSIEEFVTRNPDHAETIRSLFPALLLMEEAGLGGKDGDRTPPRVLGDFRLLRVVGRGGMGVVYEAVQESLDRRVALKILPAAATLDARHLKRFHNEARAAAQLHHSNIVPVYGVGSDQGIPYYAMQFIDGRTLADLIEVLRQENEDPRKIGPGENAPGAIPSTCEDRTLPTDGTLFSTLRSSRSHSHCESIARLGVQAAEALEYAHQCGVIHRDIKPGNLMIDTRGHVWVTDFGLAQVRSDARLTTTGAVLGTLRYMSPEQALANHGLVDHRADVYSLGITLYELLTLRPAFTDEDRPTLFHRIISEEPASPRSLNPAIPRELETVVLKAIAKEPPERYATAQELADDLRRVLDHRPVLARRPSVVQRIRKWVRRNRAVAVTAAAAVVLLFAVVTGGLAASNRLLRFEKLETQKALDRESEERGNAERERNTAEESLYRANAQLARIARADGDLARLRRLLQAQEPRAGRSDRRGWEWYYLQATTDLGEKVFQGHTAPVRWVAFRPDGKHLASAGEDGTVRIWEAATGRLERTVPAHDGPAHAVVWRHDGKQLASGGADGKIHLWDPASGAILGSLEGHNKGVTRLAWNKGGDCLAAGDGEGTYHLWDVARREKRLTVSTRLPSAGACFNPDGTLFAAGRVGLGGTGYGIWDVKTCKPFETAATTVRAKGLAKLPRVPSKVANPSSMPRAPIPPNLLGRSSFAHALSWGPDDRLAAASLGSPIPETRVYAATEEAQLLRIEQNAGYARDLAWSPDGKWLAATTGRNLSVYSGETGLRALLVPGNGDPVTNVAWHPDGKQVAFAVGQTVRVCEVLRTPVRSLPAVASINSVRTSVIDGIGNQWLVWEGNRTGLRIMDGSTAHPVFELDTGKLRFTSRLTWSADRRRIAALLSDKSLRAWDLTTGAELFRSREQITNYQPVLSPGGTRLAIALDQNIVVWDLNGGKELYRFPAPSREWRTLAWSPDEGRLAVGIGRTVHVLDARDGSKLNGFVRQGSPFKVLVWSPDGERLLCVAADGALRVWSPATGQEKVMGLDSIRRIAGVAWHPDGRRFACGSDDGTVALWDPASGQELLTLREHGRTVAEVHFSRDGRQLVAAGSGHVTLWDGTGSAAEVLAEGMPSP